MKYLLAFIPPDRLDRVIDELSDHHLRGLSVSEARGFGQEHDRAHPEHREHGGGVELTRKLRLEIVCRDAEVEEIVKAFYAATHTGHRGAGKLFVLDVVDALRSKTGERGEEAIGPGTPGKPETR